MVYWIYLYAFQPNIWISYIRWPNPRINLILTPPNSQMTIGQNQQGQVLRRERFLSGSWSWKEKRNRRIRLRLPFLRRELASCDWKFYYNLSQCLGWCFYKGRLLLELPHQSVASSSTDSILTNPNCRTWGRKGTELLKWY